MSSPSPPKSSTSTRSYTARDLLIDLTPILLFLTVYYAAWRRGHTWIVSLLVLAQVAGAIYTFRVLRRQMLRKSPVGRGRIGSDTPTTPDSTTVSPSPPSLTDSTHNNRRPRLPGFDLCTKQTANPFLHPTWLLTSEWERLRLAAMAVTLVPVRAVMTGVILISLWAALHVLLFGVSTKDRLNKPLPTWRSDVIKTILPFAARCLLLNFGYFNIEEKGQRINDPSIAPIIVANHQSFVDPIILFSKYFVSAVGAIDNLRAPIIGTICEAIQTITVDRRDEKSRHQVVEQIIARATWPTLSDAAKQKIAGNDSSVVGRQWPQILIFCEGTCTNGSALITYKPGAFVAKRPVQPVCVRYSRDAYPVGRFYPAWVSAGPSIGMMVLRLWSEPINNASLEYMQPMGMTENEKEESSEVVSSPSALPSPSSRNTDAVASFARRVRTAMAERLGVPVTEHSYLDVVLQDIALAKGRKRKSKNNTDDKNKITQSSNNVGDPSIKSQLDSASSPMAAASPIETPHTQSQPILTSSVEISTLQKVFKIDFETLSKHVEKFREMTSKSTPGTEAGKVTYQQFLSFFDITPSADEAHRREDDTSQSYMEHLFHLLDEDDSGTLDIREFLLGLALLSEGSSGGNDGDQDSTTIKVAFNMFDLDHDGFIELNQLKRVFRRAFPNSSEEEVDRIFQEVKSTSETKVSSTPRHTKSTSQKLNYEEFQAFVKAHPECLAKFRETLNVNSKD